MNIYATCCSVYMRIFKQEGDVIWWWCPMCKSTQRVLVVYNPTPTQETAK